MALISFGIINKKYFKILLAYLASSIIYILLSKFLYNFFFDENIYIIYNILSTYFGEFLCFIPVLILKKKKESSNSKEISNKKNYNNHLIKYIFNNPLDKSLSNKELVTLFVFCLLSLLYTFLLNIIKLINKKNNEKNINNDYIFLSPFLSLIISIYVFKEKFYKHQYYSVIIITLIEIIKFVIEIIKDNDIDIKACFIHFFLLVISSILCSLVYGYKKLLMNFKFFSVFKCCYIFGIINLPIIIVIYIITSNCECSGLYLCKIEYNNKTYIDNFNVLFDKGELNIKSITYLIGLILLTIIISFCYGVNSIMLNNVLSNFSVCHIILPLLITQIIIDISVNYDNLILILIIIFDIIEIMMIFTFLEIIELNFFGFNMNTKKCIRDRAEADKLLDENDSDDSNEEEEERNTNIQELLNNNTQN